MANAYGKAKHLRHNRKSMYSVELPDIGTGLVLSCEEMTVSCADHVRKVRVLVIRTTSGEPLRLLPSASNSVAIMVEE
jgi:hypothetical protein